MTTVPDFPKEHTCHPAPPVEGTGRRSSSCPLEGGWDLVGGLDVVDVMDFRNGVAPGGTPLVAEIVGASFRAHLF